MKFFNPNWFGMEVIEEILVSYSKFIYYWYDNDNDIDNDN